jgi:ATP-dependent exoDNAse (exonuclease V) alpha subunit
VRRHGDSGQAISAMVDAWAARRREAPGESQLMMAYTRAEVAQLNGRARERLVRDGELGPSTIVPTERGPRPFAAGDRVMFLRNERSLGVRNGALGTVESVSVDRMAVRLDTGAEVAFAFRDYADVDHGYATTIHKAQGATVDRAQVLASPYMDRHAAYVAMSRHRQAATLHYGAESFADAAALARTLGRERAKDSTLDYAPGAELGLPKTRDREVSSELEDRPARRPGRQGGRERERER